MQQLAEVDEVEVDVQLVILVVLSDEIDDDECLSLDIQQLVTIILLDDVNILVEIIQFIASLQMEL